MEYIERRMESDDIIISPVPHIVDHYGVTTGYFLQTVAHFQIFYLESAWTGVHRISGTPAIVDLAELRRLIYQSKRVWLVTSGLIEITTDEMTRDFIEENMAVVYENLATRVYLSQH